MKTIYITVANQKGGVGKTQTVISLGHGLAKRGKRVLLVDFDPQGHLSFYLGVNNSAAAQFLLANELDKDDLKTFREKRIIETHREEDGLSLKRDNLFLLPGNKKTAELISVLLNKRIDYVRNVMRVFEGEFDYVIMDTNPSIGGLQEQAIFASDYLLAITQPEAGSLAGCTGILNDVEVMIDSHRWPGKLLGILPTFTEQTTSMSHAMNHLGSEYENRVLPPIHKAEIFRQCAMMGQTIFEAGPRSRGAQEYEALVNIVLRLK